MASASAAKTVILRYQDIRSSVPLVDVEDFVTDGETSETLQAFLHQTPLSSDMLTTLLTDEIPDTGIPLGSTDIEFLLFQLNKLVGDPLNREHLEPLGEALYYAFLDGSMSVLELVRLYPASEVRLELHLLSRVHRDIDLFVQRITPLFNFFEELLPDLVCECETGAESVTSEPLRKTSFCSLSDASNYSPRRNAEDVVFAFGLIRRSFSIAELTTFAETGNVPKSWRYYLEMTNLDPEDLRATLTSEIELDLISLDEILNSLPGEYALFQLGRIIHTPSRKANIQALRSALILSAAADNNVTLLEFLQNYPAQQLIVEGEDLIRFGERLEERGAVSTVTADLEDVLVEIQKEIANEICDCIDSPKG
ncbi:MAG: alpha/beta hydrolase [Leptolyngbyaceae cyanobacterium MO_188.B28]|nr:alpha/beta hydrolase [Leptolyngbyaceae cyanobacterium MO_188.B28]